MGDSIHDDIWEQILVRLGVKDLTRFKKVCKSWKSLISHPRFGKAHLTRHANLVPRYKAIIRYQLNRYGPRYYIVGSSNGLACIKSFAGDEIIVLNPWTREERKVQKLPVSPRQPCWGFGFDSLTDDYKVVFGVAIGKGKTTFYVLSLKSNVWKHVGFVNYPCFSTIQIGTLCNGALHWVMYTGIPCTERLIISFDLCKEVFKEINQPDDATRDCHFLPIAEEHYTWRSEKTNVLVKHFWHNTRHNYYTLRIYSKDLYTFLPATVMPSVISPHLQEGNE